MVRKILRHAASIPLPLHAHRGFARIETNKKRIPVGVVSDEWGMLIDPVAMPTVMRLFLRPHVADARFRSGWTQPEGHRINREPKWTNVRLSSTLATY